MKKSDSTIRIAFTGGGTGGHIYPGIAVCDVLKKNASLKNKEIELYWIGNSSGMDRKIVEKNLVKNGGSITAFIGIPSGKLRRYFSLKNFFDLFKIGFGLIKAFFVLKKIKPLCLFSKGGYVSVPPCKAASFLHIPYFTHECDFTPGLATRLNSSKAKNIFISYKETEFYFKETLRKKCIVTGNPVRPVFYSADRKKGLYFLGIPENHEKPMLLVLGGSLGARQINDLIIENLDWIKERFITVHQTGASFAEENPQVMKSTDSDYKPYDFIYSEMPHVVKAADIIIGRAGANSLWECAVCEKPMVLIPLCTQGSRGDQIDNARFFAEKKCALVLEGEQACSEKIKESLEFFIDEKNRSEYSNALSKLVLERAAEKIAGIISEEVKL
ncbi:MAG: UDP-N-acetylglucosamine--N-acetylmuramyl-(pentapeptide) pyrophosphoryl-undecaprenol N-acetylglucosamine transferase [Treponema sp.]|nr:UDP-N-acetylglucosamine--N-acetylmuramyl-(pentapeptide) pyrophosphoryl-undecaprenol N-acetylglucosamine transferase [Treponema sp.]